MNANEIKNNKTGVRAVAEITQAAPALLPCPFCGSADVLLTQEGEGYSWQNVYAYSCFNDACVMYGNSPEEALTLWNRRAALSSTAPPQAQQAEPLCVHGVSIEKWCNDCAADHLGKPPAQQAEAAPVEPEQAPTEEKP